MPPARFVPPSPDRSLPSVPPPKYLRRFDLPDERVHVVMDTLLSRDFAGVPQTLTSALAVPFPARTTRLLALISFFFAAVLSSLFQGDFMSVNKVILVGRLGRDPETRFTSGGQAVANFSVATDETYKDKNGERQKRTEWHKIVVWGKQAEIAQQYLKKGSLVFIEGRIQSREWQDKEGQKRTSFEIVATNFRMLGGRGDAMGAGPGGGTNRGDDFDQGGHSEEPMGGGSGPEITDEDIPF